MKKLIILTASLIMSATLFGCTPGNTSVEETTETTETNIQTNVENSEASEVTINHSRGTTVVPKNPKKIAVFDLGILDTLHTLEVDVEMALPIDNIPTYLSEYKDIATNAGGIKEPNIEELFNFEPEIIFISGRQADFYDELNKIAPTVYVDLNAETYMQDFTYSVSYLSEIFDKNGDEYIQKINEKIEEVKSKTSATEEKALFIMVNNGKMSTYGKGSRFGLVFDVLGVKPADENIEVSTHGKEVSYEYIAEINPDIIFLIDRNSVVGGEANSDVLNNDIVNQTNAAKMDKIVPLNSELWYLVGGGLSSVYKMIEEIDAVFN